MGPLPTLADPPSRCRRRMADGLGRARTRLAGGGFVRSEDGIALLEFALVLPILLLLYVGTVEVANLMSNLRKLDLFTRTVGDFAGGASAPSRQEIDGMFKASKVVLMPFDTEKVEIVVSAVGVIGTAASGPMQVCSSVAASNATPRAVREIPAVAPPAELRVRGARMLLVETRMPYQPRTGSTLHLPGRAVPERRGVLAADLLAGRYRPALPQPGARDRPPQRTGMPPI